MGKFITDNQKPYPIHDAKTGKEISILPQFAVWGMVHGKNQVIDTGNDILKLTEKYNLTMGDVYQIGKGE